MENKKEKELKSTTTETTSLNKKAQPKPKPKTISEKVKEALLELKEKAINTVNTVVDYTLNNFNEIYQSATNSSKNTHATKTRVNLNEEAVTKELIAKAKQDGDSKEVVLDNKNPNAQTMVGSSLVVDMDTKKIDAIINDLDNRLNPIQKQDNNELQNKEPTQEKQDELKQKPTEKIKADNKNGKVAQDYTTPSSKLKLKPEAPKPMPKNKKELKVEEPKPIIKPTLNIQTNIEALRNKFLNDQNNNPYVLEEQQFQTVLKPQEPIFVMKDKNTIQGNIATLRKNLHPTNVPDIVEDVNGVEQRKIKARLK
jgi:uncharacterized protein (UPF0297 family)